MKVNTLNKVSTQLNRITTHEGGPAIQTGPYDTLRRLVLANMLWEDTFYVDGKTVAGQMEDCCKQLEAHDILALAEEAHSKYLLRHVPLMLVVQALSKPRNQASHTIPGLCNRPDQMTELLALYWKDGKKPLSKQLKKGLAIAFQRYDEYQLAKYTKPKRTNPKDVLLKDILFLVHPKPINEGQQLLWNKLVEDKLEPPETWEHRQAIGEKKEVYFKELLENGKLGTLAILRNLRAIHDAGISRQLVQLQLNNKIRPMLPFQFIAAAQACPAWESIVDEAMIQSCSKKEKLPGKTSVFVDVSGSMQSTVSQKSKMTSQDPAAGLAILLRECCEEIDVWTFSNSLALIPDRHGMALRDAIAKSQMPGGTELGAALRVYSGILGKKADRIIVITDEQTRDEIPRMREKHKYILNVSSNKNGLDHHGEFLVITGFSEHSIDYIRLIES